MIDINSYKKIADFINSSQKVGKNISSNIVQMRNDLDNSEVDDNNIHKKMLYNEINKVYDVINVVHNNYNKELLYLVKQLQLYIVNNYGSVNKFLEDNSESVFQYFADISETVGYPIDPNLITTPEALCIKENPSKDVS